MEHYKMSNSRIWYPIYSINNIYFIQMPNGILSNVDLFYHSWQIEEISTTGCGCWLIRLSTVEILCGFVLCTWDKSFLYQTTWRHNSHKIYVYRPVWLGPCSRPDIWDSSPHTGWFQWTRVGIHRTRPTISSWKTWRLQGLLQDTGKSSLGNIRLQE